MITNIITWIVAILFLSCYFYIVFARIPKKSGEEPSRPHSDDAAKPYLQNGVYIVYPSGRYCLFDPPMRQTVGMQVGIAWNGNTWIIGNDYGDVKWSTASERELEANSFGIKQEYECLFDWNYMEYRSRLLPLWKHIPFGDDETMPLMSQVLVQEKLARTGDLNAALRFCGLPEYETGTYRWFAQRCDVNTAWLFYGYHGTLSNYTVYDTSRCQAVALWNPK